MIIPILQGGLGNQMFQISTAFALAKDNNNSVAINYKIEHLGYQKSHIHYKNNFYEKIFCTDEFPSLNYNEPMFSFSPIPYLGSNMSIKGYFQSEKYFKKYRNEINEMFKFPENVKIAIDKFLNSLGNVYKIGVHFRRGDYLKFRNIHPIIGREYYEECKSFFHQDNKIFLNCTDDLSNLVKEFPIEGQIIKTQNELADLYLLTQCDSIIMSNSSFAWWGGWLGKKKEVICMPSKWFGIDGYKDFQDIYIDGCIKI